MKTKLIENQEHQAVTTVIRYDDGKILIATNKQYKNGSLGSDSIYISEETAKGVITTLYNFIYGEVQNDTI